MVIIKLTSEASLPGAPAPERASIQRSHHVNFDGRFEQNMGARKKLCVLQNLEATETCLLGWLPAASMDILHRSGTGTRSSARNSARSAEEDEDDVDAAIARTLWKNHVDCQSDACCRAYSCTVVFGLRGGFERDHCRFIWSLFVSGY